MIHKSIVFLCTGSKVEYKMIHSTMKCEGINLIKYTQNLNEENCKILMEETK